MKLSTGNLFQLIKTERGLFGLGLMFQSLAKIIEAWLPLAIGSLLAPLSAETLSSAQINTSINEGLLLVIPLVVWLVLEIGASYARNLFGFRISQNLRFDLLVKLLALPIPFFDKAKSGEVATYLSDDVEKVREMLADAPIPLLGNLVLFIAVLILTYQLDPTWREVFLFFFPVLIAFFFIFQRNQKTAFDKYREALLGQSRFLQEHLSGRSLFDLYENPQTEKNAFKQHIKNVKFSIYQLIQSFSRFGTGIDLLMGSVWVLATLLFTFSGENPSQFVTFSLWGTILFRPLIELTSRYNTLISGLTSLKKIERIQNAIPEVDNGTVELDKVEELDLRNISFEYLLGQPVLKNISFKVEGKVGLVGLTGAGKTTLFSLLLRFYPPTEGTILINGVPHTKYSLQSLRKAIYILMQDTTSENLSEGEKQLRGLKRAEAANPSCLLLDEATSNIDLLTERKIEKEILTLLEGRLAIVVAHRLSTLRSLDTILVMDEGKIVEQGSFEQLLAKKGLFTQFWQLLTLST